MFFGNVPFENLPPEVQAQLQHQQDMDHMAHIEQVHEVNRFLDGLDKEQLVMLRKMIHYSHGSCDNGTGATFIGRISEILRTKYNLCNCNTDHDADLADGIAAEQAKDAPEPPLKEAEAPSKEDEPFRVADEDREVALKAYHVLDVPLKAPVVICATPDCGRIWATLEERMEGKPGKGGCSDCAHREAWG